MGNSACCNGDSSVTAEQGTQIQAIDQIPVLQSGPSSQTDAALANAGQEACADAVGSICEFTIKLRRAGSEQWGLGLRRSKMDGKLFVSQPSGKAIEEWHASNPTSTIKKWDEIVAVNGVSGTAAMLGAITNAWEIHVCLRRQTRWTVDLTNRGPLGIKFVPGTLAVGTIKEGMVSRYNETCPANFTVCEGDQLVSINGKEMDSSLDQLDVFTKFNDGVQLRLIFVREEPESVNDVSAGSNVFTATRYKPWTRELAQELQEALDSIFEENDLFPKGVFSLTVADPMLDDCPIIGCSTSFAAMCGYEIHEIAGRNCRFLIDGVPKELVDQKMRNRAREFCLNVKIGKHREVVYEPLEPWMPGGVAGELFCFQINSRKDGSHFQTMFYLIAVEQDDRRYIVGLQAELVATAVFQEICAKACNRLRTNVVSIDKILASKFWYSGPMHQQDLLIGAAEISSAFPFAEPDWVRCVSGSSKDIRSAFPFAEPDWVRAISGVSNHSTKARYKLWTRELAQELQEAVDRMFAKSDQLAKGAFSLTIADPILHGCPLIGCSTGFAMLCGYGIHEIVGRNCRFLLDPVPKELVDQKMRDRAREFCHNVKIGNHLEIVYEPPEPWMPGGFAGELFCFQTNARKDGSHFRNMFYLVAVMVDGQPYIIGLQAEFTEGSKFRKAFSQACKVLRSNKYEVVRICEACFGTVPPLRRQELT